MKGLCREPQCGGTLKMLRIFSCSPLSANTDEPEKDHERVDFNIHRPTYSVTYLGYDTLYKPGLPEMCDAVKMIFYQNKPKLKSIGHFSLTLSKDELTLRDRDSTEDEERVFGLRRILFCGVYKPKQSIFFFNYQFGPKGEQVDCHAVLCKNKKEAKSLAEVIRKAFRETQHDAHIEEMANKRKHAQGLSKSLNSLDQAAGESSKSSVVDANRHFYMNLNYSRQSTENATGRFARARSEERITSRRRPRDMCVRDANSTSPWQDSNEVENINNATQSVCRRDIIEVSQDFGSTQALITSTKQKNSGHETDPLKGDRVEFQSSSIQLSSQDNGIDTRL